MKSVLIQTFVVALFAASSAWAAGGAPEPAPALSADPVVEKAQAAIARLEWTQAREIVREGLARNPGNADYHNLYAYTIRMGANPAMDLVFKHYNEALRLDTSHRRAHEYLGEAYLMVGNLDKAKDHLQVLDRLCFFPCEEYTMLKKAVADYEARQARK